MQEEWKSVNGYEGIYEVSTSGLVRSLDRYIMKGPYKIHRNGKVLKSLEDSHGYLYVCLAKDGVQHQKFIHVLVANAFLLKPDYKVEVNHIDGDKHNNTIENLEWVTHRYNVKTGLHSKPSRDCLLEWARKGSAVSALKHSIPVLCETDGLAFISQNAADRFYGYHVGTVSEVVRRTNHTFKGKSFRRLGIHERNSYTLLS